MQNRFDQKGTETHPTAIPTLKDTQTREKKEATFINGLFNGLNMENVIPRLKELHAYNFTEATPSTVAALKVMLYLHSGLLTDYDAPVSYRVNMEYRDEGVYFSGMERELKQALSREALDRGAQKLSTSPHLPFILSKYVDNIIETAQDTSKHGAVKRTFSVMHTFSSYAALHIDLIKTQDARLYAHINLNYRFSTGNFITSLLSGLQHASAHSDFDFSIMTNLFLLALQSQSTQYEAKYLIMMTHSLTMGITDCTKLALMFYSRIGKFLIESEKPGSRNVNRYYQNNAVKQDILFNNRLLEYAIQKNDRGLFDCLMLSGLTFDLNMPLPALLYNAQHQQPYLDFIYNRQPATPTTSGILDLTATHSLP